MTTPLNAFGLTPGTNQGRIKPSGWIAPDGSWVLCIGSDRPGLTAFFNTGDQVGWGQNITIPAPPCLLRIRARVRGPKTMPAGLSWQGGASLVTAGATVYPVWTVAFTPGETRDFSDIVVNLGEWMVAVPTLQAFGFGIALIGTATFAELELPALYIDALVIDQVTTATLIVGNRLPEPGDAGVLTTSTIVFDILAPSSNAGVDLSHTQVLVNGVMAYSNGAFQAPWTGTAAATTDYGAHFLLTPPTSFTSQELVTVHVLAHDVATGHLLDTSWSFTVQDLTAPIIASVLGLTTTTARVFFSEPMVMVDATSPDDALDPANYTFAAQEVPAAAVTAISVVPYSASAVEVTVDLDFSPGRLYQLAVVGVEDLAGNPITPPNNTALFYAFRPPAPAGRNFDLWKMIPLVNRQRDVTGDLKRFVDCLQDVTDLMLYDIDRFTEILDPDKAPEWALDLMLEGLGNPFPFALSATDKRRLIRVLVTIYRLKGTAVGIVEVVRFFLGLTITITTYQSEGMILGVSILGFDWTLGASKDWDLYAFEIESSISLTVEQATSIATIANYMKPAHTHLAAIVTPAAPITYDPLELGLSRLGLDWTLHG